MLCGYGGDGSTDDNKPQCDWDGWQSPAPGAIATADCVPGCGQPPQWCRVFGGQTDGWQRCGFDGAKGANIQPFKPADLNVLLMQHAQTGRGYRGIGNFEGYNEIVVDAADWVGHLPRSVEAIFIVECKDGDRNLDYGGGGGLARSCKDAQEYGRRAHRGYLLQYKLTVEAFPLLRLRPANWEKPFVVDEKQPDISARMDNDLVGGNAKPGGCLAEWSQCGGQGFIGQTNCCGGLPCLVQNEYWHRCGGHSGQKKDLQGGPALAIPAAALPTGTCASWCTRKDQPQCAHSDCAGCAAC